MIMVAIPVTVFLVQQQLNTRSEATPSSTLAFLPNTKTVSAGENVSLDIVLAPGTNSVSFIKLAIKFDPTKLSIDETGFSVNTGSKLIIQEGPVIGTDTITVSLITGSDPTRVITENTTIGTITFYAENPSALPTKITFDNTVLITSTAGGDTSDENVFLNGNEAAITILDVDGNPVTDPTTEDPDTSISPEPTSSDTQEQIEDTSGIPTCSGPGINSPTTGVAPYTITFTASGTDIDGTIESATLDYGDGNTYSATESAGIGTGNVDINQEYTYESIGVFTANVIFTDDEGNKNDTTNCKISLTITDFEGNTGTAEETANVTTTTGQTTTYATATPEPTVSPLPPTGPAETIVGIGALGGILVIIGTLIFLAL